MHFGLIIVHSPTPVSQPSLLKTCCIYILRLRRSPLMNDLEQRCGTTKGESLHSLQKQVHALRRLLEKTETVLAEKRAKEQERCLHARRALVPYGGPRDNGELDYQCIDCGALI